MPLNWHQDFLSRVMMQQNINRLRHILSRQIIPHVSSGTNLRMILAQRPLRLPAGITVKRRPAPSLICNDKKGAGLFWGQYPEGGKHAIRFPYLCYVMEGEMDMRLGIPTMRGNACGVVNRYEILTLPEHTSLIVPPGVFFPDGTQIHWERASPPTDSHMFWVHILPTGIFCHTSGTHNAKHTSENHDIFVPGQHFSLLTEMHIEQLQFADPDAKQVAQHALLLLLSQVMQGLKEGTQASLIYSHDLSENDALQLSGNSFIVQRACKFIRKHKDKSFSIGDVAAYAYVSPSHLMRLFRTELNSTVMEYAEQQRFAVAETWLINSNMSINQIARFLSYKQTPQFIRAFKRLYGINPTEFRQRHKRQDN